MIDTAEKFKALGDENRFRIFMMLGEKSLCACELREVLKIAGSTLSVHLRILRSAGLIEQKKNGRWIEFSQSGRNGAAAELARFIRERLAPDDPVLAADRDKAARVSRENLKADR